MKIHTILSIWFYLLTGVVGVLGVAGDGSTSPDCVPKCWENSRIVSSCSNETKCLCEDLGFQGAVFQCLYSQCQTSQFGIALHQALAQCSTFEQSDKSDLPPLIRQQGLRKRDNTYTTAISGIALASGYATASATFSTLHYRPTGSVSAYYRTRSAGSSHYHSGKSYSYGTTSTTTFSTLSTIPSLNEPTPTVAGY